MYALAYHLEALLEWFRSIICKRKKTYFLSGWATSSSMKIKLSKIKIIGKYSYSILYEYFYFAQYETAIDFRCTKPDFKKKAKNRNYFDIFSLPKLLVIFFLKSGFVHLKSIAISCCAKTNNILLKTKFLKRN